MPGLRYLGFLSDADKQSALAGAHVATLPFKVLQQMIHHPLTDSGIVQFKKDWAAAREAAAAKG